MYICLRYRTLYSYWPQEISNYNASASRIYSTHSVQGLCSVRCHGQVTTEPPYLQPSYVIIPQLGEDSFSLAVHIGLFLPIHVVVCH